jgi:hypothetical protein
MRNGKYLLAVALFAMSGCATIFGDSKDVITINSNDPSAKISINGNVVGKGSAQYALTRGREATITASKPGCDDRSVQSEKRIVGATWLNVFFWPGFIVDIATGSYQKTDPTFYTVTPYCG